MSFYQPENFLNASDIELEKSRRVLQPVWELIKDGREDALRSPLFPALLAIVFYFFVTSLLTAIDFFGQNWSWLEKYRLQPDRKLTWRMIRSTLVNAFWNHLLFIFPLMAVQLVWVPPTPLPPVAPTLWEFFWQQVVWFFLFDFQYWAWHVLHHKVRFLYRWCHSVHHQYHAPFALATQHLHPWEIFCIGMAITMTPWPFKPHCMTYWSWFIIANWVSIEVHLGYDMPWAAHNWLPIYGGAPSHDMHHMRPLSNFQPWLNYLDALCGWRLTHQDLQRMKRHRAEVIAREEEADLKRIN